MPDHRGAPLQRGDASTTAAATTCTGTGATRTSAWSSRPSSPSPSSAATPTTSCSPATTSTWPSSASTTTASRCRPRTSWPGTPAGPKEGDAGLRLRPPGRHRPAAHRGRARVPARRGAARRRLMRLSELRGALTEFQTRGAEQKRVSNSLALRRRELAQGPEGAARGAGRPGLLRARRSPAEEAFRKRLAADPKNGPARAPGLRRHPAGRGPPGANVRRRRSPPAGGGVGRAS